ncbi:SIMPL domain-containing protein [Xanthomonas phaseoli]|uniref:SIMPL domain-containing protein n=1 Tax=Xanthomonas phaseoli pv. dieffenbachiae TaxID=92828 RepID=A0A1V9H016_9XANT|nr:SIMPL domain-containing protein [Xanthomonas phaseoli]MBO9789518.1 SIMPL domain-containing protein [Xanthomonas phaseoli pv. dieffenbachiae]MBO9832440.1 SIMPL domain-containing protein [Xanthomonas phaseoli pv. dieffenbachiae]MBO9836568.1 SIMPL domain-containing protein [Xanthomonas phaseoli pv. dieffenbachiae]MBO9841422.1 SIMPL domain-containing protein [Xanthomonas phaseoli pv. dieffenbachiae]MBO9852414.1 SIMPL domain-containing protein [Xanthomonas phaseoli pv. dieffenbachiae]
MKQLTRWMLVALCALPLLAVAQVNSLPSQPHLLVKGQAERTVMPDRFFVTINFRAVDMQPELARRRIQTAAEQILAALKTHHALKDSIEASSLQIQPFYSYVPDGRQKFEGTEVKRGIGAAFQSLEDARQFLGEMKTSSEIQLSGIKTSYSKEAEIRAQLKRDAADQSRKSAAELAKAYDVRIQGLYTISEVAPNFAYGIQAGSWPMQVVNVSGSPAPPAPVADRSAVVESLEASSITLTENIYAVFLIAQ